MDKARCPSCNHEFTYSGTYTALLDRLPTGGFSGHVTFAPRGQKLPDPAPKPERPEDLQSELG
jgi:hypothetical protein